ncbi:MAG: hypothetical protein ACI8UO_005391 [Verrucomicrobiales bacterium]|jgi:hypothetical protein
MTKRKNKSEIADYSPRILTSRSGVARPVTRNELDPIRKCLGEFFGTGNEDLTDQALVASIQVEGGEHIEIREIGFRGLWDRLVQEIEAPTSMWRAVEIRNEDGKKHFKFDRPVQSSFTLERLTDGLSTWSKLSIPVSEGDSLKFRASDLSEELDQIESGLDFDNIPGTVFEDSFYSPDELASKGVTSFQAWEKHLDATENEERVRAWVKTDDGKVVENNFPNYEDAKQWVADRDETQNAQASGIENLQRKLGAPSHPLKLAASEVLARLATVREKLGESSPKGSFSDGLKEGLQLGLSVAEFQKIRATPLGTFKHDMTQRKGAAHPKTKSDV